VTDQRQLFFESLTEAIRDTITALGGPKAVGHHLKPEKSPDAAGRWLNDTLNDSRPDLLSHDHLLLLAQMGRRAGVHNIMTQLCRECGYADPVPMDPEDEQAQLQKEFIRAAENVTTALGRLDGLKARMKVVA